jgi:hypothetical protein
MKEQNRNRIAIITGRYDKRIAERGRARNDDFDADFERARRDVIRPAMEDIAAELARVGHSPTITLDGCKEVPSIELRLGIHGADPAWPNVIAYCVVRRRGMPEVLAYLDVNRPVMDLIRYAHPKEIAADQVEQLVLDAVEHIFACNAV